MRNVTFETVYCFLKGRKKQSGNTYTDGVTLYLHDNPIAWKQGPKQGPGEIVITLAGWNTKTTRERLNGILELTRSNLRVAQRDHTPKFYNSENGKFYDWGSNQVATIPWDGKIGNAS